MLIELRVENHRSVRDEQALTMEAGRVGDAGDPRPRVVDGHGTPLLTVAALYGANASGKSNVLSALAFMREAVLHSHRLWSPDGGVAREPFAWGAKATDPSLFEVTLLLSGVRYQYGFVAGDERFLEEWLYAWPKGRKQTWLEREWTSDGDVFRFGEGLRGENRLVQGVTRPNALFLSAAVQHHHEQLAPLYLWFAEMSMVRVTARAAHNASVAQLVAAAGGADALLARWREGPPVVDLEMSPARLDRIREVLRAADVGIIGMAVLEEETGFFRKQKRVRVQHRCATGEAWLPLEEESNGTQALVQLAPTLLDVLESGRVIVIDELEASLHPLLAAQVVRLFNDPKTNPRNAQMVFATHDTHLLGPVAGDPLLRRDQVWLTEKDAEGATVLYPLTDYKPRKAENLERGYLQGRYGAIPFLGDLALVSE